MWLKYDTGVMKITDAAAGKDFPVGSAKVAVAETEEEKQMIEKTVR